MVKNYLKSYFNRALKYKAQFLITLLSIILGFVISLCCYNYINFEFSYDDFHSDESQIFRLIQEYRESGKTARNSLPLAPAAKREIPEVLSFVRLYSSERDVVAFKEQKIKVQLGYYVDTTFFNFFSFPLLKGKAKSLNNPNGIFISKSLKYKLFENKEPIGKIVTFDNIGKETLTVLGVFEVPENSHLQFEWIRPNIDLIKNPVFTWDHYNKFVTYFKIQEGKEIQTIENKVLSVIQKNDDDPGLIAAHLQPLDKVYLSTEKQIHDVSKYGNEMVIRLLFLITILIVIILWTNLFNIIFVSINNRVKEFTIRKACGANYSQLVRQLFLETFVMVLISGILSLPLIQVFAKLASQELDLSFRLETYSAKFIILFIVALLINILVLGIFNKIALRTIPTDRVSRYQNRSPIVDSVKRVLLMIQLAGTIFIITFMLIINKQVDFMLKKDLGINIKNVLLISDPTVGKVDEEIVNKGKAFRSILKSNAQIENISVSTSPGTRYNGIAGDITFKGKEIGLTAVGHIDPNFLETFDVKLLAGRNLSYSINPWVSILINEKMVKKLGLTNAEEALNNTLLTDYTYRGNLEIVGVIEDYHHLSIDEPIEAACFILWPYAPDYYCSVKLKSKDLKTIAYIESKYYEIFGSDYLFDYKWLEDHFSEQYSEVVKFKTIISYLMILIVFICCIGVYGLFSAELSKKVKSIAVRRCLGAQKHNILYTLIENYYLFILIASVVTIPISYYIIKNWLSNFAYTVEVTWKIFITPVIYLIIIILVTILNKLISALRLNTTEALKYE